MNRRQFLYNMLGSVAAAKLPQIPILDEPATDRWIYDVYDKIYDDYIHDFITYGTGAIATTEEYPYLRNVPISEILALTDIERSDKGY